MPGAGNTAIWSGPASVTNIPTEWMKQKNQIEEGSDVSFIWFAFDSINSLINETHYNFEVWHKGTIVNKNILN